MIFDDSVLIKFAAIKITLHFQKCEAIFTLKLHCIVLSLAYFFHCINFVLHIPLLFRRISETSSVSGNPSVVEEKP